MRQVYYWYGENRGVVEVEEVPDDDNRSILSRAAWKVARMYPEVITLKSTFSFSPIDESPEIDEYMSL